MTRARGRQKQARALRIAPSGGGRDWRLAAFLGAVFVVKLIVLLQLQHHPLLEPGGALDSETYSVLADRVRAGDYALGPGLYFVSPLYIYFLAALLSLSDSFTFVRLVQIALGTAAVACVFWTAREWFGRRAAWIAAALAALTGEFTFYEIVVFQSSLDTFLTAAGLLGLTLAIVERPPEGGSHVGPGRRQVYAALSGVLFGLQILNRPNIIIAVAGVVCALLAIRRARVAAMVVAGVLLALAPVVVRNAIVARQFAIAGSQGGLNFYIGNNAAATGQYVAVPGVRANMEGQSQDTRTVAEQATGRQMSDAQVSSYFTGQALGWMRGHPAAAAALLAKKLALVFNARHQWLDFSYPYYAYDTGSILWTLFVGPWLLVPLGLAGLVAGPSALRAASPRRQFIAWGSFVPFYALSVALFFVAERYRLPLFIPLCVTGAATIETFLQAVSKRTPILDPRTAIVAAITIAAAVLTAWPFHTDSGRFDERLRLSKVLMNRGDFGEAATVLDEALRLQPSHTTAEFNLGMALVAQGRAQEGIAHLKHAIDAGVAVKGARYALASTLLATGERDEAVRLLRSYQPQPEDDAASCFQVAVLAMNADAPGVAVRYARRALELRPGWPEAQQLLGQATSRIPR